MPRFKGDTEGESNGFEENLNHRVTASARPGMPPPGCSDNCSFIPNFGISRRCNAVYGQGQSAWAALYTGVPVVMCALCIPALHISHLAGTQAPANPPPPPCASTALSKHQDPV